MSEDQLSGLNAVPLIGSAVLADSKRGVRLFWPGLGLAFAATCITVGLMWDISWHSTIGRDTFWTPAHMVIYLGGALGGCIGGWLAIKHTLLARPEEQVASVRLFGARAPLGAWVAIWGAIAMLTSAPFDDWWHNAYGLDVKIVSPPHTLLSLGSFAIKVGALALMAGLLNRAGESTRRKLTWLFVFVGADCVVQLGTILTDATWPVNLHTARCYLSVA